MADVHYLTPEGKAKAKAELDDLINNKRVALARRLRDAIQQGDLSENADYHAAKEDQAFLEGKILELQAILRGAVIIEEGGGGGDMVQVGSRVTVEESGDKLMFTVVGAKEANPREGKISNESPVGKALLGRRVGEVARAATPAGEIVYKVIKIQ
ncbi:MAG: transcription elongation factor GreA [Chloroflexi bacterium]|nr:transcription elongation factor GreA [Chloroflexota bacterium]MBI5053569.1 transcription elongation factor GreA [Chloroflexota bacterium]MBI5349209.1 transcription elongation factor GreA [Chloroflexota bacterium]MBI5714187.1 transcription elongation factor GreA [Chloroflexota bacterium]